MYGLFHVFPQDGLTAWGGVTPFQDIFTMKTGLWSLYTYYSCCRIYANNYTVQKTTGVALLIINQLSWGKVGLSMV